MPRHLCSYVSHYRTIMTQTGVNIKLAKRSKRFYVLDEETGVLEKNIHVGETSDKGLKSY